MYLSFLHTHVTFGSLINLTKNIQRSIKTCDWAILFINLTINERVELLSNALINIFRNYILNKKVKFKYVEASWINKTKFALRQRSRRRKIYYGNGQVQNDYNLPLRQSKKYTETILSDKNEYIFRMSKKLNDPSTAPKTFLVYSQLVSQ